MSDLKNKIEDIWSQEHWNEEARRIELAYWDLIKDKVPNIPPPDLPTDSEHRIEKFVRELAKETEIGNLHVGLTSSDLEDNIRIRRLRECVVLIQDRVKDVIDIMDSFPRERLIAYTHLIPAGTTDSRQRFSQQIKALSQSTNALNDVLEFKGIGGALGDRKIQLALGVNWNDLDKIFFGPVQTNSSQTVDHVSEFATATFISYIAFLLAKISNDFRMMFALGQARHTQKDIGSTAIPAKPPNPWRFERVSGMANVLYDIPSKVAKVGADCHLERTLTNQSVLNHIFKDAFLVLAGILEDMAEALSLTEIKETHDLNDPRLYSEQRMLKLVLDGVPRQEAHKRVYEELNKS